MLLGIRSRPITAAGAPLMLVALTLALVRVGATAQAPLPADLVVLNAKVVTVDPQFRIVQAVAVRDARFAAVGSAADVRPLIGPATRVLDAGGHPVIPGLIDTHVHALGVAATEAATPFRNLGSVAEIQDWVRAAAGRASAGTWLWTPRVFPTRVSDRRFPTREELDAAAPHHPVVVDGAYALVLNSAALASANIGPSTPDPPGGAIVRDSNGRPTGLLRNVGALLARFRPGAAAVPLDELERVHRAYNSVGITSIIERQASVEGYRAYEALERDGRLRVRAAVTIQIPRADDAAKTRQFIESLPLKPGGGGAWLKAVALKLVADGGILLGTSFMREPFGLRSRSLYGVDNPSYRGFLSLTRDHIASAIALGHARGWQMVAHVTGDAGVDVVLDAFAAAQAQGSAGDRRHTLIHAYFPNPQTAARAARLGVLVDTQPAWYYKDADALAQALGTKRLQHFIGLRTWLDAGVRVAINTDHMFGLDSNTAMNPFNPFLTMYVAVTRRTEGGTVYGQGEAITREEALRLMTLDAARLSFDEATRGSIEVGKLGDLAILSDDLLTCQAERIKDIKVLATFVGGREMYRSAAFTATTEDRSR